MAKLGGPILTISMLWFGWTSYPHISLWAPVLAGLGTGLSIVMLFLSLFNYIIDAYLPVAASALAASTVVRSAFGAAFPVRIGSMSTAYIANTPLVVWSPDVRPPQSPNRVDGFGCHHTPHGPRAVCV